MSEMQIDLGEALHQALEGEAQRRGVSSGELARRILRERFQITERRELSGLDGLVGSLNVDSFDVDDAIYGRAEDDASRDQLPTPGDRHDNINVALVDPRDVSVEVDYPAYRVYVWSSGSIPWTKHPVALHSTEYRLTGPSLSVGDVLDWTQAQGIDPEFQCAVVYVENNDSDGQIRLTRLAGNDPSHRATF
jgi:hypothetical protein